MRPPRRPRTSAPSAATPHRIRANQPPRQSGSGSCNQLCARLPNDIRYVYEIYETTDWYNNQSSLNGAQAAADKDSVLRIVVSARDPGVPNRLDTAGYSTGVIQGRWMECSSKPVPKIRKVALAQVRQYLPAETPTISGRERDEQIRNRRAVLQQRPLW